MHFPLSYHSRDSGAGRQKQSKQPKQPKQQPQQTQQQQQTAGRSHGRHHSHGAGRSSKKSQPFDPDDLRRRLYVVLAEQEASKNRKHHSRQESAAAASAAKVQEQEEQQRDGLTRQQHQQQQTKTTQLPESQRDSYWEEQQPIDEEKSEIVVTKEGGCAADAAAAAGAEAEAKTKAEEEAGVNNDDGDRNAGDAASSNTTGPAPYRHVPQTAASQFVQTTTATTTDTAAAADGAEKNKKRRAHALSYSALRRGELSEKMEGGVLLVRETAVPTAVSATSTTKPKSKASSKRPKSSGALRKLRSHHQHPEQDPLYETDTVTTNTTTMPATAARDQNSLSIPSQDQLREPKRYTVCGGPELAARRATTTALGPGIGVEDYSTDEDCYTPGAGGLHLAATAAHGGQQQRRKVDWTQSDEAARGANYHNDGKTGQRQQQRNPEGGSRPRLAFPGGPALHRVESIWTLKAKLGSLIRTHSSHGAYPNSNGNGKEQQQQPPAVQEIDEITPPSSSGSPKSPRRLAFLGRFRR